MGRLKLQLSPGLLLWLAAAVMLLPIRWIFAWIFAVCVHELGHLAMLKLLKLPIHVIEVDTGGARISTDFLAPWQELLCALAGPAAGFLLLIIAPVFPRISVCGMVQSMYNLLPVYPLDGGRCLRCLAGEHAGKLIQTVCLACIPALGCYATLYLRLGFLPLIFAWVTVLRALAFRGPR